VGTSAEERRSTWPRPFRPRLSARFNYRLHPLLAPTRVTRALAAVIERFPRLQRLFTAAEKSVKESAFGCQMCGQCALPSTGYACPQTCPKQLRNGPCGGVSQNGDCEVFPGTKCVWLTAYERCEETGRLADLTALGRPLDHRLTGSSSWLNYWQGRDDGLYEDVDDTVETWPARQAS
jgi:hypothetical protein